MHDIIQKVMATEAEAKQMRSAAQSEAARILSEAQKRAAEIVASARQAARLEADQILTKGWQAGEVEKKVRLAHAIAVIESQVNLDDRTQRQVVEAVTRCVCGFQLAKPGVAHDATSHQ